MNYSIENIDKINFEAPFLNVSLVTLSFESETNYRFEELVLNFIYSKLECETLYKFENKEFYIQNGSDKGNYNQKTFGPYQAEHIGKTELRKVIDSEIPMKFKSILPEINEINQDFHKSFKKDMIGAQTLIHEFLSTREKLSVIGNWSFEIAINSFDMDLYACFFGQKNENSFQILTFDDE